MTFAQPQLYLLALCASYISGKQNDPVYDEELLIIIMYPLLRVQLDVPILYPYARELIAGIVKKQQSIDFDLNKIYASVDTHVETQQQLEMYLECTFNQDSNKFRADFVMNFLSSTEFYDLIVRFVTDNTISERSVALSNILVYNYIQSRIMINNISVMRHLVNIQPFDEDTSNFQIAPNIYN